MSKHNGVVKDELMISDKDFVVDKKSNTVFSYNADLKKLLVYDHDGNGLAFENLSYKSDVKLKLIYCHDGKLIFYDYSTFCFYFSD